MKHLTAAIPLAILVSTAQAGSSSGPVTNQASVADACDVAAIGVDFGMTTFPLPAAGITSAIPNTASGNAITGNTGQPGAGADTGETSLNVSSGVSAIDSVISTALSTLSTAGLGTLPGVYVICTTAPTSITLTSANGTTINLGTATSLYSGSFSSKMVGTGSGAGASNKISYTLTLSGTPVSTGVTGLPLNIFSAAFTASGNIPASQAGNTIVPGSYSDTATATVNF